MPQNDGSKLRCEDNTFVIVILAIDDIDVCVCCRPLVCVEVGCGSGAVSVFVASMLGSSSVYL